MTPETQHKPCPHVAGIVEHRLSSYAGGGIAHIYCITCHATGPTIDWKEYPGKTKDEIIALAWQVWDARPEPTDLERMREMLTRGSDRFDSYPSENGSTQFLLTDQDVYIYFDAAGNFREICK